MNGREEHGDEGVDEEGLIHRAVERANLKERLASKAWPNMSQTRKFQRGNARFERLTNIAQERRIDGTGESALELSWQARQYPSN